MKVAQDTGTTITATLAAFGGVKHATFTSHCTNDANRSWTAGSGFSEIAEGVGGGAVKHAEQWKNTNDTSAEAVVDQNAQAGIIAIEIKNT